MSYTPASQQVNEDVNEICSLVSSNVAADDLPDPGRHLGRFYTILGKRSGSSLGTVAEGMGYGSRATALKIWKISTQVAPVSTRRKRHGKDCKHLVRYATWVASAWFILDSSILTQIGQLFDTRVGLEIHGKSRHSKRANS